MAHSSSRRISFSRTRLAAGSAGLLVVSLFLGTLSADTIHLKNGQHIPDARILKEDAKSVSIDTPSGKMTVPRDQIARIQRVRTIHDSYREQLEKLHENDLRGMLELALWCRKQNGLRAESDALLEKILEASPDSTKVRELLGHVRVGKRWVVPPPLKLDAKCLGQGAESIEETLKLFLAKRKDVTLLEKSTDVEPGKKASAKQKSRRPDPLDVLEIKITNVVSTSSGSRFFGQSLGNSQRAATVTLEARSPWLRPSTLKTRVVGQIPNGQEMKLGIQNAVGSGGLTLHQYLDKITQLRVKALAREYRKSPPPEEDSIETPLSD